MRRLNSVCVKTFFASFSSSLAPKPVMSSRAPEYTRLYSVKNLRVTASTSKASSNAS